MSFANHCTKKINSRVAVQIARCSDQRVYIRVIQDEQRIANKCINWDLKEYQSAKGTSPTDLLSYQSQRGLFKPCEVLTFDIHHQLLARPTSKSSNELCWTETIEMEEFVELLSPQ